MNHVHNWKEIFPVTITYVTNNTEKNSAVNVLVYYFEIRDFLQILFPMLSKFKRIN